MTGHTDRFLLLSDSVLESLEISGRDVVDAIEAAILQDAAGQILTAPKSAVVPDDGRYMMTTLSTSDAPDLTIVKSVMVSPRNPDRGRPGIDGAILIQDSETGQMRALAEAGWITGVRTAGLSAVAARRLANAASRSIAFQVEGHLVTSNDVGSLASARGRSKQFRRARGNFLRRMFAKQLDSCRRHVSSRNGFVLDRGQKSENPQLVRQQCLRGLSPDEGAEAAPLVYDQQGHLVVGKLAERLQHGRLDLARLLKIKQPTQPLRFILE